MTRLFCSQTAGQQHPRGARHAVSAGMIASASMMVSARAKPSGFFALLCLAAAFAGFAQAEPVWVSNQAARLVIGQTSFTRQDPATSRETIGATSGIAIADGRLFVADGNEMSATPVNHRVLIYNDLSSFIHDLDAELPQSEDDFCPVCVGLADVVVGQSDFDSSNPSLADGFQNPVAVASDGFHLAVADADNNRVLIWLGIPASNGTPPDIVLGQPDFTSQSPATSQEGMRGPQGVWIDNGRLFVADTQNSRVLIYNSIPAASGAGADIVLGQPDFNTRPEPDLTQSNVTPSTTSMLDPVSVSVNNGRLFVTDLGFNRVLIFFTIPTSNAFPADVVVGQPDFDTALSNDTLQLCEPIAETSGDLDGDGEDDGPIFPARCDKTLSFPRYALSDGTRLYIADGGNDRILIYDEIPAENGTAAGHVLGQPNFRDLEESDGAGSLRAPSSLAWDGTNLYVAEPFSRRVLVFTPAENLIEQDGLVNAASFRIPATGTLLFQGDIEEGQEIGVVVDGVEYIHVGSDGENAEDAVLGMIEQIQVDPDAQVTAVPIVGTGSHAVGRVTFSGEIQPGDLLTMQIAGRTYQVTVEEGDEVFLMVDKFAFFINQAADPDVFAERDLPELERLRLIAHDVGRHGNDVAFSVSVSPGALIVAEAQSETLEGGELTYGLRLYAVENGTAGNTITLGITLGSSNSSDTGSRPALLGSTLTGGSEARELPAGTLVSLFGENLSDGEYSAVPGEPQLPTELGGLRVYTNGVLAPLFSVTPAQVNFQVPFETVGTSMSVFVWKRNEDGPATVSVPRAARVSRASPGIFAYPGPEPRRAVAVHATGLAQGAVAVSTVQTGSQGSTIDAGILVTISVNGREYAYTTVDTDTAITVRDRLVEIINAGEGDPEVIASAGMQGFFSARATITISGEIQVGDIITITVRDRSYLVVVQEGDTVASVRNKLVDEISFGQGDPEVTARRLGGFDPAAPIMQVVARSLGDDGNEIPFAVTVNEGALITAETNVTEGFLIGGQTPPVVLLTARVGGREGNKIQFSASSADTAKVNVVSRRPTLCCGNVPFSLITDENPAVPGESIVVFATGLGLPAPLPITQGVRSGQPIPLTPLFNVPFVADDFVSSLLEDRGATVQFVGLMPGQVGVYQVNLLINDGLQDNPNSALTIAQIFFVSNVVSIPVKNLQPRDDAF